MLADLITFLQTHQLHNKRCVVAVSGGADSLALLHLLLRTHDGAQLLVAHLNHQLRGAEADADAAFVAQTAQQWGVAYEVGSADVPAMVRQHGYSVEEAARRARYQFLATVATRFAADAILTAHHADDQAETVLLNLLRGSGLTGLGGIRPIGSVPYVATAIRLARPLLTVSRATIDAYVSTHQLAPRFDSSNNDLTLRRNLIRRQLLPSLEVLAPQLRKRLQQLAELAAADDALLDTLTASSWQTVCITQSDGATVLRRATWQALPLSLRRRTLRYALVDVEAGFAVLEQARGVAENGPTGATASLPAGWRLRVDYETLVIERVNRPVVSDSPQCVGGDAVELRLASLVQLENGWVISAEMTPYRPAMHHNQNFLQAYIAPQWAEQLQIRPRRPGERIQPLGLAGRTKKVKDVMVDRKLPAAQRARWPLVAGEQHALWIVGHLLDERARISADCAEVICLRCYRPVGADQPEF